MTEVADRIDRHRQLLSPAERQVAEVVLRHPEGIAFGTVAQVAAVADTSGASVVRLATRLGYRGFSDLQEAVRAAIGQQLRPAVERIRAPGSDGSDVVDRTLAAELLNVQRTLDAVDPAAFARAVDLLADERRPVRVVAGDAEAGIGTMLADGLSMLRPDVSEVSGSPVAVARRLAPFAAPAPAPGDPPRGDVAAGDPPRDDGHRDVPHGAGRGDGLVLVAVDLRRYERWVVEAADRAVAAGAALIAVTDSRLSPLAGPADVAFTVAAEGAGPFDSHVGTLALVNALVAGVAGRLRRSATDRLDRLEAHWRATGALLDG